MNTKTDKDDRLVLDLLEAVGKQNDVSQRYLANQMGVALGLANSYLKRCIHKGWIKINQAPANRFLYYLTPTGFAEKSRLTAEYLTDSFQFYRRAGESCAQLYAHCENNGWRQVILCGCSDLAEIAVLRAQEMSVEVLGIYDPGASMTRLAGRPVWKKFSDLPRFDVCILTDVATPARSLEQLVKQVDRERILVPDILRLG